MSTEKDELLVRYTQLKVQYDQTILQMDNLEGSERQQKAVHGRILNNKLLLVKQKLEDVGVDIPVHDKLKGMLKEI